MRCGCAAPQTDGGIRGVRAGRGRVDRNGARSGAADADLFLALGDLDLADARFLHQVDQRVVPERVVRVVDADGHTVVMVTHDVLAATYGDRTVELRDGRIVRDVRTPLVGLRASGDHDT